MTTTARTADGDFVFRAERAWDDDARLADGAVARVVVLGDIHGRTPPLLEALAIAEAAGAGAVVQVGDFWLQDATWGRYRGRDAKVVRRAMAAPIPVVALDGNHEVWPSLTAYASRPDMQAARSAGRPLHLGGSLWWADRGSTWTWSGTRCGALGGAVSPDRWMGDVAPLRWADAEAPTAATPTGSAATPPAASTCCSATTRPPASAACAAASTTGHPPRSKRQPTTCGGCCATSSTGPGRASCCTATGTTPTANTSPAPTPR